LEAGQRIRDYILEEKIGAGGAGEVWGARHQYLDDTVAIKAIYRHASQGSDFQERFLEEAKVMASLKHPHIVSVRDFFFLDDMSYLVMTYIAGGSLADLIARRGHLPLTEAMAISREILDALNFAHSQGVIHRDVKPSNILVRPDGHVCLVDFGIALVVGKRRHTRFGINIGTPEYMSPEQIQGQEIDHRTDVYSFGCVLYEMLTGQPPFGSQDAGQSEYEIMSGHVHAHPPSLRVLNPEVDEHIETVVIRALAKTPDQRYGGCQELAKELDDIEPGPSSSPFRKGQKEVLWSLPQFFKRMCIAKKAMYIASALLFITLGFIFLYGTHVANRKKEYAREEDHLNAFITNARDVNAMSDALQQEIAQLETEQEKLKRLLAEIDIPQQALAQENQVQTKSRETTRRRNDLQAEITRLEGNKVKLENDLQKLNSLKIRSQHEIVQVPSGVEQALALVKMATTRGCLLPMR
jgi:serine/threonine protein kinase